MKIMPPFIAMFVLFSCAVEQEGTVSGLAPVSEVSPTPTPSDRSQEHCPDCSTMCLPWTHYSGASHTVWMPARNQDKDACPKGEKRQELKEYWVRKCILPDGKDKWETEYTLPSHCPPVRCKQGEWRSTGNYRCGGQLGEREGWPH